MDNHLMEWQDDGGEPSTNSIPPQEPHSHGGQPGSSVSKYGENIKLMLKKYGVLGISQKFLMLQLWILMNQSIPDKVKILLRLTSDFLDETIALAPGSGLTHDDISKARDFVRKRTYIMDLQLKNIFLEIIASIPDDDWLRFTRTKLGIPEQLIAEVKSTCQPSVEQLDWVFTSLQGGNGEARD